MEGGGNWLGEKRGIGMGWGLVVGIVGEREWKWTDEGWDGWGTGDGDIGVGG